MYSVISPWLEAAPVLRVTLPEYEAEDETAVVFSTRDSMIVKAFAEFPLVMMYDELSSRHVLYQMDKTDYDQMLLGMASSRPENYFTRENLPAPRRCINRAPNQNQSAANLSASFRKPPKSASKPPPTWMNSIVMSRKLIKKYTTYERVRKDSVREGSRKNSFSERLEAATPMVLKQARKENGTVLMEEDSQGRWMMF